MMRQMFICFDFDSKEKKEIFLSNEFFGKYYAYLKKNHLPFMVEDLVAFYFIENGYEVNRTYLGRNAGLDLIVLKDNIRKFIEVKSLSDSLKLNQLEFIFSQVGCQVFWILPDKNDLSDLAYGGK